MLKSMTGFGRYESVSEARKITVEIKAVNHRYLDLSVKMSKKLGYFEAGIRALLKNYIQRGKVDVFITYEDHSGKDSHVVYNRELASQYINYLREMKDEYGLTTEIDVNGIGRFPDVFTIEEESVDENMIWQELEKPLREACERFVAARETEGEKLLKDLLAKLDSMQEMVAYIEAESPKIIEEYKTRLTEKINELGKNVEIDAQRIATEVTIFADKVCVDEEIVRLKSHVDGTKAILVEGGSIGRKLDFLVQEMNREANTILSKSNTLHISNKGIDLKTEIEKIREQIQNIE